jgi:hypothetical protein
MNSGFQRVLMEPDVLQHGSGGADSLSTGKMRGNHNPLGQVS